MLFFFFQSTQCWEEIPKPMVGPCSTGCSEAACHSPGHLSEVVARWTTLSKAFVSVAGLRMLSQLLWHNKGTQTVGLRKHNNLVFSHGSGGWKAEIKVSQGSVTSRGLAGRILPASFSFWGLWAVAASHGLLCLHRSSLKNKIKPKQEFNC